MTDYSDFLATKAPRVRAHGFDPVDLPSCLFPFQRHVVERACRSGRFAMFEDCGLGKTLQQLVWADQVVRHTSRPVLILAPLAVGPQTEREARRFGIDAQFARTPAGHLLFSEVNEHRVRVIW